MTIKKYEVTLHVTIDTEETPENDWNWLLSAISDRLVSDEAVELDAAEFMEEWDKPIYDTGDASQFKKGDKVVLTSSWDDYDEYDNSAPVDYDSDLDNIVEKKLVGTVLRVDDGDNTVEVRWEWTDEDGDEGVSGDFWVLPRCLGHAVKEESVFKTGDKVRVVISDPVEAEKEYEQLGLGWDAPGMNECIDKIGTVCSVVVGKYRVVVEFDDPSCSYVWLSKHLERVEAVENKPPEPEFKPGDKVKITAKYKELVGFNINRQDALKLHGKIGEVHEYDKPNVCVAVEGIGRWWYSESMLQKVA